MASIQRSTSSPHLAILDQLEGRRSLSTIVISGGDVLPTPLSEYTVTFEGTAINVTGTSGNDIATIEYVPKNPAAKGNTRGNFFLVANGQRRALSSDEPIRHVNFNGGDGDDKLSFAIGGRFRKAYLEALGSRRPRFMLYLFGGNGKDTLDAAANLPASLQGQAGNDTLLGSGRNDILDGGAGDDLLDGRGGGDTMNGGDGIDAVDYSSRSTGVFVDLFNAPTAFNNATITVTGSAANGLIRNNINFPAGDFAYRTTGTGPARVVINSADSGTVTWFASRTPEPLVASNNIYFDARNGPAVNDGRILDTQNGVPIDSDKDLRAYAIPDGTNLAGEGSLEGDNVAADVENVLAGSGNDVLLGNQGYNLLNGGAGNDSIVGGLGGDLLVGGDGDDFIFAADRNASYPVSFPTASNPFSYNSGEPDRIRAGAGRDFVRFDCDDSIIGAETTEKVTSGSVVRLANGA
jgi:Ca2+-binding RTX toxin-like protein